MRYSLVFVACCCVVLAACGVDTGESPSSSSSVPPLATLIPTTTGSDQPSPPSTVTTVSSTSSPTSIAPSSTTTATTTPTDVMSLPDVPEGLSFLLYGDEGLYRVEPGASARLVSGPVGWAADDFEGGVLFKVAEEPELFWLRPGESEPVELRRDSGYWNPTFTAQLERRTVLFFDDFPGVPDPAGRCPDGRALGGYDLSSGEEEPFVCFPMEDAGFDIRSFGAGLFVGSPYSQYDSWAFWSTIQFWDTSGGPVEVAANPYPSTRSCEPCELAALISSDGRLLAYRFRPDALHPDSPSLPADFYADSLGPNRWWEESRQIPATVAVVDLTSGEELWRTEIDADVELGDFDGRYVVLHRREWPNPYHIRIVDTWDEQPDVIIESPGTVGLARPGR